MNLPVGLILDILMITLLLAVIAYAVVLNRRLKGLRDTRLELREATRSFAEAAIRADAGIRGLKAAASEVGETLDRKIKTGQKLKDELGYLVDAGEALAARLEGGGAVPRPRPASPEPAPEPAPARPPVTTKPAAAAPRPAAQAPAQSSGDLLKQPTRSATAAGGDDEASRRRLGPDRDLLKTLENLR